MLPVCDSEIALCFVCVILCPFYFCNHHNECLALFDFLVPHDCCVALPPGATGLSAVCDCSIC